MSGELVLAAESDDDSDGGAERRVNERQAVNLRARVDVDGRDERNGHILDFCIGGLFLRVEGQEDDYLVMAARQIGRGARLRVTFQADGGDGPESFAITVKVARLFPGGMGVTFDPPEPAAIRALQRVAERAHRSAAARSSGRPAQAMSPDANTLALFTELRQRVDHWLREKLDETFRRACDALFVEARDAISNEVQMECLDAMKDVERVKPSVRDTAVRSILRAFDRLSPAGPPPSETQSKEPASEQEALSLIDTGSFDDWVTSKNIMSRHEPKVREAAYALARRLAVVAGRNVEEAANPVGVESVCTAFNESMQNLGLQRRSRKAIYQAFESLLVGQLGELYAWLNANLMEHGVLPKVERPLPSPTRPAAAAGARTSSAAAPPAPSPDSPAPGHDSARAPGAGSQAGEHAHAPAAYPGAPGSVYGGPGAQVPVGAAPSTAPGWSSLAARSPAVAPAPGVGATFSPHGDAYRPAYQSTIQSPVAQVPMAQAYQAARNLLSMQRAVSAGAPIARHAPAAQQLAAAPAPSTGGASAALMNALGTLQSAPELDAAQQHGAPRLKDRLRRFLEHEGVVLGAEESEAIDVLAGLIEAVLGDPLIDEAVKPRIQRLSVPLLRNALFDQGFFMQDANPARQVMNRLGMLGLPETLPEGEAGDSLVGSVDPLLERIVSDPAAGPAAFEAVLPELDALVERQQARFAQNVGNLVANRERQQAMLAERRHAAGAAPARRMAPELEPWFQRTRRLKVGDVVTFKAGSQNPDPRTLAWTSEDRDTFVFTDRTGRQSESVAQQELALELLRGSARVLDSPDVPAMDRGVYQMLHEIHRALTEEGRRDSVSGLMPLSAFMVRIEDAIARAQRRGSKHALLALNLDGFDGINQKCGRKAGDSLLRKLSGLLERQIGAQGCITRSYADEFLILLEDHSFQDARRFAERQCRAIDNSRVVFEGEQYPITASIGLVPVTRAGASAEAVVDDARAALAGAKRRGGNQLRVFDPDEDHPPPEKTAAAPDDVSRAGGDKGDLGALLDAERLVLRRQAVTPIAAGSEAKTHYEVLLALRTQAGEVEPVSADLLLEAERGERMADVDRWAMRTALTWMAANRREVVRSGGFAIKLSGASLSDEGLLQFVVGALTETSVPPAKVIFEVTESVAIDRLSSAVDFIHTLREYGCRFAIADFGAGHATFSYLKTLPVDFVKIDGLFVHDLAQNNNDFAMVKSINEIAHLLGKLTIAEHVDSEPVLERLKQIGVDYAQGKVLAGPELLG